MIETYQSKILTPGEIVDYSNELIHGIRPETIQMEPLIGFKVLLKDMNARMVKPSERFRYLESNLMFLKDSGCIIRETTPAEGPDGFWLITFPVPQSWLANQIAKMTNVMEFMAQHFGIVPQNMTEINVSGRCLASETEWRLGNVTIPNQLRQYLVEPANTPYKMGHIIRINDEFALLRTMWDWRRNQANATIQNHMSDLLVIPQLIAGMFR